MEAMADYLNNQLLIAMPSLRDPNFSRAVTYVCQHNESGALGITVNRRSHLKVGEVLDQLGIDCDNSWSEQAVLIGGPVQPDRGFVLHHGNDSWNATFQVTEQIALTTSRDILQALAAGEGPDRALLALGYAGWAPGQLESEMLNNAWLNTPAESAILFDSPLDARWEQAAATIGVDIQSLSGAAGHA